MKWLSLQYNAVAGVAVSVDTSHMVEYWCGPKYDYQFPKNLQWEFKTDTDLFDFLKASHPVDCFSVSLPLSLSHSLAVFMKAFLQVFLLLLIMLFKVFWP